MIKPEYHYFPDGKKVSFKEICIFWCASHVVIDDIRYKLPERWREEHESIRRCY